MILPSKVKFFDEKLKNAFEVLQEGKDDRKRLYSALVKAFDDIEKNAFCGVQIPKRLIPKQYFNKYHIHNLWKYDLPKSWRLIYSVVSDEIIVFSVILEWLDHKDYEKRFNY